MDTTMETPSGGKKFAVLLLPEKIPQERWIALGVFAVSLAYLWLFRRYTFFDPDEGIVLQGAQRILNGQIPYRDFFSFYTPGSYFLLASIFKVFGSSFVVARTALAFYGALMGVFSYLLARRVCSRWIALATACLVLIAGLPWRFMVLHNWDSTLLACVAVYCCVWLLQAPNGTWAFATGTFTSLTILFEQSKGAGLVLGFFLAFALLIRFARSTIRLTMTHWIALGVGLLWPFAVVLAYFGFHGAIGVMLADWFWPLQHYSKVNSVPYGYMNWGDQARHALYGSGPLLIRAIALFTVSPSFLLPALPVIALFLLFYWLTELKKLRLPADRAAYYILLCSVIAGLLFSVLVSRADILHFVYLAPLFYLVLGWVMEGADIRGRIVQAIRPLLTVGILFAFSALGLALLVKSRSGTTVVKTRRGTLLANSRNELLEFLQAHVPAGSRILVYPYLPLYYYLTETQNPTAFDFLQPGMFSNRQEQMLTRQIGEDGTPVIVFQTSFTEKIATAWPGTSLGALGSDRLADFILSRYHPCRVLNSTNDSNFAFIFLIRKNLRCPGESAGVKTGH